MSTNSGSVSHSGSRHTEISRGTTDAETLNSNTMPATPTINSPMPNRREPTPADGNAQSSVSAEGETSLSSTLAHEERPAGDDEALANVVPGNESSERHITTENHNTSSGNSEGTHFDDTTSLEGLIDPSDGRESVIAKTSHLRQFIWPTTACHPVVNRMKIVKKLDDETQKLDDVEMQKLVSDFKEYVPPAYQG